MREEHARNDLTRRAVRALAEIGAGLRISSARPSSQDSDAAARSWLNGDEARKFVFNALVIVLVLVFAAVVAKATMKRGIVIEPVSVPKELSDRGYTAEVVAQQIIDEISSVVADAETSRELGSVSMLSPERPTPKVELPGSGISIAAVIYYLREFLGVYDTKISGDVTHEREKDGSLPTTPRYLLRVRIADPFFRYVSPASSGDIATLFRDAALPVLEQINPYIAGLTYLHRLDYVKASRMAQVSLRSPVEAERQWGHNLRGAIAGAKSRFSEAKSEYAGTVLNNSGFRLGQYNVASVALAEKQYAEALELSLSALSVDDNRRRRALGYHNAGMALERMRSGKFKFQSNVTLTALLDRFFGKPNTFSLQDGMYWTAHTFPNDSYFEDISGAAALGLEDGMVPSRQAALAVMRQAVETDPMYFPSFYQLGTIGYDDGADSKRLAEQDLEKAVALMTDRTPVVDRTIVHHYLGRIRADRDDYDAAYKEFDAAIKGRPAYVWPYIRWSEALIARLKKENDEEVQVALRLDAAGHMMRAVALSEGSAGNLKDLAENLESFGMIEDAVRTYEKLLTLGPDHAKYAREKIDRLRPRGPVGPPADMTVTKAEAMPKQ